MTSISIECSGPSVVDRHCASKTFVAILLVAIADWLFYGRGVGISAALFLACIAGGVVAANRRFVSLRVLLPAVCILLAALLPLCSAFSLIGLLIGIAGTACFAVMVALPRMDWISTIREASALPTKGPWQSVSQMMRLVRIGLSSERASARKAALVVWIVPLLLGAVFVALFASANPLIEGWLGSFDPKNALALLDPWHTAFWALFLLFVWPFIFMRRRRGPKIPETALELIPDDERIERVLNSASILRSLLVFNVLFAVQSVLDVAYLWGGVTLPAGMSHATYAHRGAYPLVVAALLAAAFVLIAMRPGSDSERSPLIRKLVYLWTAQTLLLVVSSILRLDLYVEAYSLTYWRLAAFVWMVLVATGLVLIAARIMLQRSNLWLIIGNGIALMLALYVLSIVNLPSLIAHYNVVHSRDVSGEGALFDIGYVASLGPQAIPALDLYLTQYKGWGPIVQVRAEREVLVRNWSNRRQPDWRAWTYWDWRLSEYLKQQLASVP